MATQITIAFNSVDQLRTQIEELYKNMFPEPERIEVVKEIPVKRMPTDPHFRGSNVLTAADKMQGWISENVEVGGNFSILTLRLELQMTQSDITSGQLGLRKRGIIKKTDHRGIWQRVL